MIRDELWARRSLQTVDWRHANEAAAPARPVLLPLAERRALVDFEGTRRECTEAMKAGRFNDVILRARIRSAARTHDHGEQIRDG